MELIWLNSDALGLGINFYAILDTAMKKKSWKQSRNNWHESTKICHFDTGSMKRQKKGWKVSVDVVFWLVFSKTETTTHFTRQSKKKLLPLLLQKTAS